MATRMTTEADRVLKNKLEEFCERVEADEVPERAPDMLYECGRDSFSHLAYMNGTIDAFAARDRCTRRNMWAIVDLHWTRDLAEWIGRRSVLEVMAGRGFLAAALNHHGVYVHATDNGDWRSERARMEPVRPVREEEAGVSVAKARSMDMLLVAWPPYMSDTIVDVCRLWGTDRPIVYIGEDEGGCCAPDEFFAHFQADPHVPEILLPCWPGMHDVLEIGYWRE